MRSIITFIILLISSNMLLAQEQLNPVDLANPDLSRLELLTFEAVNNLRKDRKLLDLVWDDVLKRAAKDHADYLVRENKFSHFQIINGKKTPMERVKIHGGIIYTTVGENIVKVTLGVYTASKGSKLSTITYQSSAKTMAQLWKHSSGHYRNIISRAYNCSAIAVAYDNKNQSLIAVQVFGYSSTPSSSFHLPDSASHLLKLSEKELPNQLKKYEYKVKHKKAVHHFTKKLVIDKGYLTGPFKVAKRVFRGRRSGIAQEFIPLSQFDSNSSQFVSVPNRRNALYELNGDLAEPVYRRKLLRYSRKYSFREYLFYSSLIKIKERTKDFIYPLESNGNEWEYNLFLIKDRRLAAYKSYISVPGKLFDDNFPKLNFVNSFYNPSIGKKVLVSHTYDTLRHRLYFQPNMTAIPFEKQEEITKGLAAKSGKLIKVEVAAYSSIEGDKISNDKLAAARMGEFAKLLEPYKEGMVVNPVIKVKEQWELFYKQIARTPLQSLRKTKGDEIRKYVNQHKKDSLLSELLNQQRYMEFTMIWRKDYRKTLAAKSSREIYNLVRKRVDQLAKPKGKILNELEKGLLSVYWELAQGNKDSITLPNIPDLERYPAFKYHELVFRYTILQNIDDKQFYDDLHILLKSKYFPAKLKRQAVYNNLVFIYQKYLSGQLKDFLKYGEIDCYKYRHLQFYFKKFKKKTCRPNLTPKPEDYYILKEIPQLISRGKAMNFVNFPENQLSKFHYLYTIHSLSAYVPTHREIHRLLPNIKKRYHPVDSVLGDAERLKLAYFYCCFAKYRIAKDLLKPCATRAAPNTEALKLYVTLLYEDYKEEHEYIEMLIKEFPRLGKLEWCDLWFSPDYLNFLLLEDLKLKNFYNCNCDR